MKKEKGENIYSLVSLLSVTDGERWPGQAFPSLMPYPQTISQTKSFSLVAYFEAFGHGREKRSTDANNHCWFADCWVIIDEAHDMFNS